jgi:hypothetical protein
MPDRPTLPSRQGVAAASLWTVLSDMLGCGLLRLAPLLLRRERCALPQSQEVRHAA